jgi:hypothetical protein
VLAEIRRVCGAGGRGKGGEVTVNSPCVDLRSEMGRGRRWQTRPAAPSGGGLGGARSGEVWGIAAQQGEVRAPAGAWWCVGLVTES